MGGGPETPQRGDGQKRELLLSVQPLVTASKKIIDEIKEEFPHLDVETFEHPDFFIREDELSIPEGKRHPFGQLYHHICCTCIHQPYYSRITNYTSSRVFKHAQTVQFRVLKLTYHTDTIKRATYIATNSWLPPTPASAPNLKFIQFSSAGVNHISKHPIYTDTKIPLLSANGVHGPQIAEWVIMMDLIHHHNYVALYEQQRRKEWLSKTGMGVVDRVGRRVGILGYGSIGRQGKCCFSVVFNFRPTLYKLEVEVWRKKSMPHTLDIERLAKLSTKIRDIRRHSYETPQTKRLRKELRKDVHPSLHRPPHPRRPNSNPSFLPRQYSSLVSTLIWMQSPMFLLLPSFCYYRLSRTFCATMTAYINFLCAGL
jgi:hypothetical protein